MQAAALELKMLLGATVHVLVVLGDGLLDQSLVLGFVSLAKGARLGMTAATSFPVGFAATAIIALGMKAFVAEIALAIIGLIDKAWLGHRLLDRLMATRLIDVRAAEGNCEAAMRIVMRGRAIGMMDREATASVMLDHRAVVIFAARYPMPVRVMRTAAAGKVSLFCVEPAPAVPARLDRKAQSPAICIVMGDAAMSVIHGAAAMSMMMNDAAILMVLDMLDLVAVRMHVGASAHGKFIVAALAVTAQILCVPRATFVRLDLACFERGATFCESPVIMRAAMRDLMRAVIIFFRQMATLPLARA